MNTQFAQAGGNIQNLIHAFGGIINTLIKLGVGAGLLVFLWGLAIFVFKSGDPGSQKEGRARMIWGVVALFVMMSVWGIIYFMRVAFGLDQYVPSPGDPGFHNPTPHIICTTDPVAGQICTQSP